MIDLLDLAGKLAESLVDLTLLAPETQQGQMLAEAISQLGSAFLEKSGAIEGNPIQRRSSANELKQQTVR
jgi:hypothetical protein